MTAQIQVQDASALLRENPWSNIVLGCINACILPPPQLLIFVSLTAWWTTPANNYSHLITWSFSPPIIHNMPVPCSGQPPQLLTWSNHCPWAVSSESPHFSSCTRNDHEELHPAAHRTHSLLSVIGAPQSIYIYIMIPCLISFLVMFHNHKWPGFSSNFCECDAFIRFSGSGGQQIPHCAVYSWTNSI